MKCENVYDLCLCYIYWADSFILCVRGVLHICEFVQLICV